MPICTFHTNLPDEKVSDEFVKEFSQLIADTLPGKTIDVVTVHLHTNARVFRGGTADPVVSIGLASFNVFSPEKNPEYANKLLEYIHKHLNVSYSRITLHFMPMEQWHVGLKT